MLAVLIGAMVGFACGAILGIADCKKTFDIPVKAKPEQGAWFYYTDLVSEYEVENCGSINA